MLYDDGRVLLEQERYDAVSPALWCSAILVAGLLTIGMGWWWVHRCRRTAAGAAPAFAMEADGRPGPSPMVEPSPPLGDAVPAARGDAGGRLSADGRGGRGGACPGAVRLATDVKGNVRDGGLVVARCDGQVLWPRGRLRS